MFRRLILLLLAGFLGGFLAIRLVSRIAWEENDQRVNIAVTWQSSRGILLRGEGEELNQALSRLSTRGINSVFFFPFVLDDLISDGTLIPDTGDNPSIIHFRASGQEAINFLYPLLRHQLGPAAVSRIDFGCSVQVRGYPLEYLRQIPLGFPEFRLRAVRINGLTPVCVLSPAISLESFFRRFSPWFPFRLALSGDWLPTQRVFLQEQLRCRLLPFLIFEGEITPSISRIARVLPRQVMLVHLIPGEAFAQSDNQKLIQRAVRAVKERGCRYLLWELPESVSGERIDNLFLNLREALDKDGFTLLEKVAGNSRQPSALVVRGRNSLTELNRQTRFPPAILSVVGFLAAIYFPWLAACFGFRRLKTSPLPLRGMTTVMLWLKMNALNLGGAILVAALLSQDDFFRQVSIFRGVKLALFLPLIGLYLRIYSFAEIRAQLNRSLRYRDIFAAGLLMLVGIFLLLRSGNYGWGLGDIEEILREYLGDIFGVRPRFKEFLFGQPLLLFSLWVFGRFRLSDGKMWDSRPLFLLGGLALTSVMNTFLHLHTPFLLSFSRSCLGMFLGLLFGGLLIFTFRAIFWIYSDFLCRKPLTVNR